MVSLQANRILWNSEPNTKRRKKASVLRLRGQFGKMPGYFSPEPESQPRAADDRCWEAVRGTVTGGERKDRQAHAKWPNGPGLLRELEDEFTCQGPGKGRRTSGGTTDLLREPRKVSKDGSSILDSASSFSILSAQKFECEQ